jgi:predicted transcriptional regulator
MAISDRENRYVAPALRRQEVLRLHAEGQKVREIAEAMEITTQAVYWHLAQAGIRLKDRKSA